MGESKSTDKIKDVTSPKDNKAKDVQSKKEDPKPKQKPVTQSQKPQTENKPNDTLEKTNKHKEKIKKAVKLTNSDISNLVRVKQKPKFRVKAEKVKGLNVSRLTEDTVIIDEGIAGIRNYEFEIPYIVVKGKGKYVSITLTNQGRIVTVVTNNTVVSESTTLLLEVQ